MLSGILCEFSGSHHGRTSTVAATVPPTADQESDTTSQGTVRPRTHQHDAALMPRTVIVSLHPVKLDNTCDTVEGVISRKKRHGRVAAIAGVFTGIGALISVFVLVRLPQKIAEYLERQTESILALTKKHEDEHAHDDLILRRATVASFWLVAALALLVAAVTALGLRQNKATRNPHAVDGLERRSQRQQRDYGALHDSTIALADDTRQARRARLRQRLDRRSQESWTNVIRSHVRHFIGASIGGFR